MAWIGSDGKESKDGKDDGSQMMARSLTIVPDEAALEAIDQLRQILTVDVRIPEGTDSALIQKSNQYWARVQKFGMLDSSTQTGDGLNRLVLLVKDEAEATELVKNDPLSTLNAGRAASFVRQF